MKYLTTIISVIIFSCQQTTNSAHESGDTLNTDSTVHFFYNSPKFTVKFKFDSLDIKIDNEPARAIYSTEAAFNLIDTMHLDVPCFETATFIKENDIWKMEKWQSVKIAQ